MSMIRKISSALIVLSVMAFQSVSQAETRETDNEGHPAAAGVVTYFAVESKLKAEVNLKELNCLARNIYYEAGAEPEEGKVAVGLVTINRSQDSRFANSICAVVNQKTVFKVPKQVTVKKESFFRTVVETQTVYVNRVVCQFSWRCEDLRHLRLNQDRWLESQRVARELLEDQDNYSIFRAKYADALYFHAGHIRPAWAHQKTLISKIGGHKFYKERRRSAD